MNRAILLDLMDAARKLVHHGGTPENIQALREVLYDADMALVAEGDNGQDDDEEERLQVE